jgi:small subunit ribosomal protein S6
VIRAYELMIMFDNDQDDASIQAMLGRITELVQAQAGRIANMDRWGRRRLAYEINKKHEAYYVVLEIVTEADNLDEIERVLRIADGVVRHKSLRLPDKEAARRGLFEPQAAS